MSPGARARTMLAIVTRWLPLLVGVVGLIGLSAAVEPAAWRLLDASAAAIVVALLAVHVPVVLADAAALRLLMPKDSRIPIGVSTAICWASQSVARVLPTAHVGGEAAKIRLLVLWDVDVTTASAMTFADAVVGFVTLLLFAGPALAMLPGEGPVGGTRAVETVVVVAGVTILGLHLLTELATSSFVNLLPARIRSALCEFTAVFREITRHPRLLAAAAWRYAGWALAAAEVWIGLHLLGQPTGVVDAFVIEASIQVARGLAFMIPGALGVQEGAILLVAALLGVSQPAAFAFAALRRARELVVSLGGLALWQRVELRRA